MKRNLRAGHRSSGGLSLNVFTDDELNDIHLSTLEVLQRTGVWVEDDEALDVFARGGAEVDRAAGIVRIPAHVVEEAIRCAPPTITLCGRTAARVVVVESGRVGFTNFGEGIKVTDIDSGELRAPTKRDVAEATRLIDALPEIDVLERPVGAHDVLRGTKTRLAT
jgi:trimethylamine--corrinoid protein Co-methyltransferase